MCLSSAVKVKMVNEASEHPGLELIKQGHPVVICTDDPLNFCCTLSSECGLAAELLGYSVEQMLELQSKASNYLFS
jgi:adenosine deaminase